MLHFDRTQIKPLYFPRYDPDTFSRCLERRDGDQTASLNANTQQRIRAKDLGQGRRDRKKVWCKVWGKVRAKDPKVRRKLQRFMQESGRGSVQTIGQASA
jgi:hypothetical protein